MQPDHWLFVAVTYVVLNVPLAAFVGRVIKIGQSGDKPRSDPFAEPLRNELLDSVPRRTRSDSTSGSRVPAVTGTRTS
jgi:hypothetical protein